MTDSNISGSSSRDGRSTEIEKLVDALCEAVAEFQVVSDAWAGHQAETYQMEYAQKDVTAARAALLEYLADRTLTAEEAEGLVHWFESAQRSLGWRQSITIEKRALEKLRRLSSPTEEPKNPAFTLSPTASKPCSHRRRNERP